ncbi:MAG: carboxypeptidase-like regulatory domain-containing protein, partial [Candidatus Zixiibacteriota bacterium]
MASFLRNLTTDGGVYQWQTWLSRRRAKPRRYVKTDVSGVILNRIIAYSLFFILPLFSATNAESAGASANVRLVQGVVYDTLTSQPIPYVTVQVSGTGKSALVNLEGHYRLMLPPGRYQLKFSHIGYLSKTTEIVVGDSSSNCNAYLQATVIQVNGITAYEEHYDPAQQIIIEAIRRKKDILERIHDYRFDAYTKLVVREKPKPDSSKIWLITETQLTCSWEQPDKYKEIITARKQSSNLPAEGNLVGVGEILNFNRNRIDLGRYSIVSPTAKDALDHYNYYLKDSVYVDNRRIYRLEIEP